MHACTRILLALAAGLGLAAATLPARAAAAAGPDTAFVRIGPDSLGAGAFVAWPASKGPAPLVLVGHEWWGLNAQIRTMAVRLAGQGYVAAVPDLYHGRVADDPERAHILSRGLEYDASNQDLDEVVRLLGRDPRVAKGRVAVIGFCMGGGVALAYGLHEPALRGVVMFYGPPFADEKQLAALKAPLLGNFGEKDEGIPPAKVKAFGERLKASGHDSQLYEYPDAGHAFMNDTRPSYSKDAAALAWKRTLDFLAQHLSDEKK